MTSFNTHNARRLMEHSTLPGVMYLEHQPAEFILYDQTRQNSTYQCMTRPDSRRAATYNYMLGRIWRSQYFKREREREPVNLVSHSREKHSWTKIESSHCSQWLRWCDEQFKRWRFLQPADVSEIGKGCFPGSHSQHLGRSHDETFLVASDHLRVLFPHDVKHPRQQLW